MDIRIIYNQRNITINAYVEVGKSGKKSKGIEITCGDDDMGMGYLDLNQNEVKKLIESLNVWLKEEDSDVA